MNLNPTDFRKHAKEFVEWMASYMENVGNYPVKSQVAPKEIYDQIRPEMPVEGESIESIFADFEKIILPGITHWQSPNFHAYFPANSSVESLLAEMLTASLGIQGMKWITSPASTELEERMMEWLGKVIGIPETWTGVIQDSASSATLAAIISAREAKTNYQINQNGFQGQGIFKVYCSDQTHSSIEKGAAIAGIGKANVTKIETDELLALRPDLLRVAILADIAAGHTPLCIVAAVGTTGTMAMDPVKALADIAEEFGVWLHIDAAYAGSALILPEYHHLIDGIEKADSFVFNPHKWLFTNFDCSAYFVKDTAALVNAFAIRPEYLKTSTDGLVSDHCDWGVQLGRRFRSLKLWFVMRSYGLKQMQKVIASHIEMAKWLEIQISEAADFELVVPRSMNLVCFRLKPKGVPEKELNALNANLLERINTTGEIFISHTTVHGTYTIRMVLGQTYLTMEHVRKAWGVMIDQSSKTHGEK